MNEQDYLLEALREIARRAADDTLGIQAARLVAIANQAHAAIKKAEAPALRHSPNNKSEDIDNCAECGRNFRGHDERHMFVTPAGLRARQEVPS